MITVLAYSGRSSRGSQALKGPSPKVAIVTPIFREAEDVIGRCIKSVDGSYANIEHIIVVDGTQRSIPANSSRQIIQLPTGANDFGDTPRVVGAAFAFGRDAEYVVFLDADNKLVDDFNEAIGTVIAKSGDLHICRRRNIVRSVANEVALEGQDFWDTSQFVFTKRSIEAALYWVNYPRSFSVIDDRMISAFIRSKQYAIATHDFPIIEYSLVEGKLDPKKTRRTIKNAEAKLSDYNMPFNIKLH